MLFQLKECSIILNRHNQPKTSNSSILGTVRIWNSWVNPNQSFTSPIHHSSDDTGKFYKDFLFECKKTFSSTKSKHPGNIPYANLNLNSQSSPSQFPKIMLLFHKFCTFIEKMYIYIYMPHSMNGTLLRLNKRNAKMHKYRS